MCSRLSLPEIKATALEAKLTMETWQQSYLDVRKKIEQSGRDARWEFDRKKLFERSDYIAQVCTDIHDIAQVQCMFNSPYIYSTTEILMWEINVILNNIDIHKKFSFFKDSSACDSHLPTPRFTFHATHQIMPVHSSISIIISVYIIITFT